MKRALDWELGPFPLMMPMHLNSAYDCTNRGKLGLFCGFEAFSETFDHTS
jgi:hypothetical protein